MRFAAVVFISLHSSCVAALNSPQPGKGWGGHRGAKGINETYSKGKKQQCSPGLNSFHWDLQCTWTHTHTHTQVSQPNKGQGTFLEMGTGPLGAGPLEGDKNSTSRPLTPYESTSPCGWGEAAQVEPGALPQGKQRVQCWLLLLPLNWQGQLFGVGKATTLLWLIWKQKNVLKFFPWLWPVAPSNPFQPFPTADEDTPLPSRAFSF